MLDEVSGPERRCDGGTDNELLGIAGRWAAVEAWAFAARLGVLRELIRRRPRPDSQRGRAGRGDAPTAWERGLEHEVSVELRISLTAAGKLLYLAWALEDRLPRVGQALDEGRLDPARVRVIVDETDLLDDALQVARAEEMILAGLGDCKTWAAVQRLAALAVCTVDPGGAARRREVAEREHARIRLWRESSGAAGLGGYSLPPDETLAAMAHVEARAQWYRKAGIKERIDMLRVMAFLDLLSCVPADDRVTRWRAGQAAKAGAGADEADEDEADEKASDVNDCRGDDHGVDDGDVNDYGCDDRSGGDGSGSDSGDGDRDGEWPGGSGGDPGRGSGGGRPRPGAPVPGGAVLPALPALVNLTLPLATQMRLAERPGEARGLGALDPGLVRRLAEAAARSPHSKFCVTIVDEQGHAVAHGCCKPARKARGTSATGKIPAQAQSQGAQASSSQGGHARSSKASPGPAPPKGPASPGIPAPLGAGAPSTVTTGGVKDPDIVTFTSSGKPGPPGGYGSWVLTLPGAAAPFTVDLYPVPVGECDHRYESLSHDPGDRLRHLIQVRDGKCSFPTCSRYARETDFEHGVPYEKGGRTCGCNCHSCSRACHQVKQQPGWAVAQERPGWRTWTTPSGRTYTQGPWKYPA